MLFRVDFLKGKVENPGPTMTGMTVTAVAVCHSLREVNGCALGPLGRRASETCKFQGKTWPSRIDFPLGGVAL